MRKRLSLALGVLLLMAAWLVPAHTFSIHMTAHMTVVAIAAPLLAYAVAPSVRFSPLLVSLLELAVVWLWHTPSLHHAARMQTLWFIAEQASFLASGLLLWIAVLNRRAEGIVALLLTAMHMTLLGALLALSPRSWYAHSTLDDQQTGGVIMLLIGGAAYLTGGLLLSRGLLTQANVDAPASATD